MLLKIHYFPHFRHFSGYCHLFHQILLEEEVLPQLLLGIRDSHDSLVAESLRALADLVPLLGASKVIGKNRRKVFANGYPGKVCFYNITILQSYTVPMLQCYHVTVLPLLHIYVYNYKSVRTPPCRTFIWQYGSHLQFLFFSFFVG